MNKVVTIDRWLNCSWTLPPGVTWAWGGKHTACIINTEAGEAVCRSHRGRHSPPDSRLPTGSACRSRLTLLSEVDQMPKAGRLREPLNYCQLFAVAIWWIRLAFADASCELRQPGWKSTCLKKINKRLVSFPVMRLSSPLPLWTSHFCFGLVQNDKEVFLGWY